MAIAYSIEPRRDGLSLRPFRPVLLAVAGAGLLALGIAGASRLIAQIEGERGIPPIASSEDIQVSGIKVNVTAETGEKARREAWRIVQRKAWEKLNGPKMSDADIDAMVSAIVIEREQIGPRRYIAQLGVIFDRTKAGQFVGGAGTAVTVRSAPLLVIPVLYSGGVRQVFEVRGAWQKAWANFQTAASPIDYVRPVGSGGESLLLTAGQPGRRSRIWWRNVLNQFEAADVITPIARLERQWPGGPVRGTFTARYGPDNKYIDSFTLTAKDEAAVPAMLNEALVQTDLIYRRALAEGLLKPDPTLAAGERAFDAALAALAAKLGTVRAETGAAGATASPDSAQPDSSSQSVISTYTVQFVTPDASAVDAALAAVRGVQGVQAAATTSLAIGGTSVMRVTMAGDLNALAAALRGQGWRVTVGSNALRISR